MIIDSAHYVRGTRQQEGAMTLADAAACPRSGSSFVWIELHEPAPELMAELSERFDLHELAVEDASRAHQRPKIEAYDDFHLLVFRTAVFDRTADRARFGEVELFVGPGYVIAVRHGPNGDLGSVRERLEHRPELLKSGPAAVVWGILDTIVDDYKPVLEGLEQDIDELERAIFDGHEDATARIYFLRREVRDLERAVGPLLEPLATLEHGGFAEIDPALRRYFRDVSDHVHRIHETAMAQRDQLATALEANVSLISLRQNGIAARQGEVVKQLTLVASVFLPLSFIVGFFGQNFGWLVEQIDSLAAFLVLGVGGLVLGCVVLLAFFRRGHYL